MTKDPRKLKILVVCFKWVWSRIPRNIEHLTNVSQFCLKNELSCEVSILHVAGVTKDTNLFNQFIREWSDVIQNDGLE